MKDEDVGTYAAFVALMGKASSELREVERTGDHFMMEDDKRDRNIGNSSMLDETTPKPDPSENADKTTLVIPPEEVQGFLRDTGVNSRPLKKFQVKKKNGQFLCPVCGHPFKGRYNAIHHSYTHMNQAELQKVNIYYQRCPHSPSKIFFDKHHFARHINSHEGIKNFKCQICKKGFVRKEHLQRHMFTHVNEGSEEVPFRHLQCYFCPKKVISMSYLIRHLSAHTKETPS